MTCGTCTKSSADNRCRPGRVLCKHPDQMETFRSEQAACNIAREGYVPVTNEQRGLPLPQQQRANDTAGQGT